MAIIYLCKNTITNRVYVGITTRELSIRKWEHTKELNIGFKGGIWQKDFNSYGKESFEYSIIEEKVPLETLYLTENFYIDKYNSIEPNGYNKRKNGSTKGTHLRDYLETSRFSLEQFGKMLADILSIAPMYSIEDLALKYSCTNDCMQDIIRCKSYTWLTYYFPEEYRLIQEIHSSGIKRLTYLNRFKILKALLIYPDKDRTPDEVLARKCGLTTEQLRDLISGKSYKWAEREFPLEYKLVRDMYVAANAPVVKRILDNTNNEIFEFTSNSYISSVLDIDCRRISDLVTGKKSSICNGRYTLI